MTQVYNDGDIQIREIKRGSKYSVRVRIKDDDGNRKYSPSRKVDASCKNEAMKAALEYKAELLEEAPVMLNDYNGRRKPIRNVTESHSLAIACRRQKAIARPLLYLTYKTTSSGRTLKRGGGLARWMIEQCITE